MWKDAKTFNAAMNFSHYTLVETNALAEYVG
jgi:hypothetical protein